MNKPKPPHKRLYDHKWRKARDAFLKQNPFCKVCQQAGHTVLAFAVDHITRHNGDPKLFWDRDNWQPLCETHHNSKSAYEKAGKQAPPTTGLDGWPQG